jgi:hypothetical protein
LASGVQSLVVPSESACLDAFDPAIWSSMDPKCFVYGDGVYGIERRAKVSFREWSAYLAERDELEYEGGVNWDELLRAPAATSDACERVDGLSLSAPRDADDEKASIPVSAGSSRARRRLPRWRAARDLQTVQYCMWRRRSYIGSARLMAYLLCIFLTFFPSSASCATEVVVVEGWERG